LTETLHWTEYLRALGPLVIALFVAFIAYQQWKVNRAALREKLFDRRWQVFKETQSFLSEILREAKYEDESYWKFTDTCQRARFLFDGKVSDHMMEIGNRSTKMRMYQRRYEVLAVGDERSELIEKEHQELKWLTDQIDPIFELFRPYLSFKETN
tara:strand:- start:564 stop:1028 length:465 start_codon:yes stop_codon:yes gene_type:complete